MYKNLLYLTLLFVSLTKSLFLFSQNTTFGWAKQIGGGQDDKSSGIAVDNSGNVYTTGCFEYTVDFDPGDGEYILSGNDSEIYVNKVDADGNFVWAKQFKGAISYKKATGICLDNIGNVLTTGYFSHTVDFVRVIIHMS